MTDNHHYNGDGDHNDLQKNLDEAVRRARDVRVMIFDVDGILTDGRLYYGEHGETLKVFHVLDGHGLKLLQQAGIQTAVISGRSSAALTRRLDDLRVAWSRQGCENKLAAFTELCAALHVTPMECGFMGDDLIDLPLLRRVRFAASVDTALSIVQDHSHWMAARPAGQGAVREVCDFILQAQGKLAALLQPYLE